MTAASAASAASGSGTTARRVAWGTVVLLALGQALLLASVGNGLLPHGVGDPYGEADAIRSSQFYVEHGVTAHAGLPAILYGHRFADEGWLGELRRPPERRVDAVPLPDGVYTRYPPLPNWLCAAAERLVGFDHLWAWRLLPVSVGLVAFAAFVRLLADGIGADRAAVAGVAVAVLPMTSAYMGALHYEGYAQSLLLLQLGLLVRDLWRHDTVRPRTIALLGALGFVQGFLSFDYAFLVAFTAVPLWCCRRADGGRPTRRALAAAVLASGGAFVAAHLVHLAQVAAFYHGLGPALADLSGRARYRMLGAGGGYLGNLARVGEMLLVRAFVPDSRHFGPCLVVLCACWALMAYGPVRRVDLSRGAGTVDWHALPPFTGGVVAAAVVAGAWYVAMPAMTWRHEHVTPRYLVLPYVCGVLALLLSVRRTLPADAARTRAMERA